MYYASTLPPLFSVEDYNPLLVSEVYARNGEKIGEFYRENRKLVDIEDIPTDLINAFLSAEDSNFYSHGGFNFKGMIRALITNLISGKKTQGASTITQQTARTLFLSTEKTYTRKIKEAILARRMEKHLSKKTFSTSISIKSILDRELTGWPLPPRFFSVKKSKISISQR